MPLSESEKALLERLTEIDIWAGKYHAPIHHRAFEKANQATPVLLSLPSDIALVKQLVLRAAGMAGVNPVVA